MSSGAPLNLTLEPSGTKGWATAMNTNLSTINTAIAALQAGGTTGPAGATGPAGPVGLIFANQWLSSTSYIASNVVTFGGGSYYAIAPNINTQPDINPSTWVPLALPGAPGPQGPTGPQGPQGASSGNSVAFPITISEGGTGAITAALARLGLGAAASGVNADITQLENLNAPPTLGAFGNGAINIQSIGGVGQALLFTDNNGHNGGFTTAGDAYFSSLSMSGGFLAGTGLFSGLLQAGLIGNTVPGQPVVFAASVEIDAALTIDGVTPAVAAGKIGIGTTTATTATAGGTASLPSTVLGFLVLNIGGVNVKVPYYSN